MTEDRVFEPTPQRLARARREGHVARSPGLTTVVALSTGCLVLWWYGGQIVEALGWFTSREITQAADLQMTATDVVRQAKSISIWGACLLLPVFGCVLLTAVVANLSQGGFVWAPSRISPQVDRLAPSSRLAGMFRSERLVDVIIEVLKMSLCLGVAAWGLWSRREQLAVGHESLHESSARAAACMFHVLFQSLAVLGVLGLVEYAIAHMRYRHSLRMTAEEWQADMKERESTMKVSRLQSFASGSTEPD